MNIKFIDDLPELWRRLVWSVLVLVGGLVIGYYARGLTLGWLQAPLHTTESASGMESLVVPMLFFGLLLAVPVVVFNLAALAGAGEAVSAKGRMVAALSCAVSMIVGVVIAYVSLPLVLRGLSAIDVSHLHPLIAADSYLSFVFSYIVIVAASLQIPFLAFKLDRLGHDPIHTLKNWRKWVILGALGAALLLPLAPDPLSQVTLAIPVILLYESSLWLVALLHRLGAKPAAPNPEPGPPTPQRLPMAIAVPKRPVIGGKSNIDPLRAPRSNVIDLKKEEA